MCDWQTNQYPENQWQEPDRFQECLAKGIIDNCDYYTLVVHRDKNRCLDNQYCSFNIPNFTGTNEEVLIYQHTLYIYSNVKTAQNRADILGTNVMPLKLPCLHCFFSESSKCYPFVDAVLDEKWHLELYSCRESSYSYISHVRVSTHLNLHQLEGCKKTGTLKWVDYPSYGDPNHPIEYCRPVPFPDNIEHVTVCEQQTFCLKLKDPETIDLFIINDHIFIATKESGNNSKTVVLYYYPIGYLAFSDIQDMSPILTRGEGVWIPVSSGVLGGGCNVFPWAEPLKKNIQYFYKQGYIFGKGDLWRDINWYINAIMYDLYRVFECNDYDGINLRRESLDNIQIYCNKGRALQPNNRYLNVIEKCLQTDIEKLRRLYLYDCKKWEKNKRYSSVVFELKEKALKGDENAQFLLAKAHQHGRGIYYDMQEAIKWYTASAQQGFIQAQHNLGIRYMCGNGVGQNIEKAIFWFKKAAQQDSVYSQFKLGVLYMLGQGVDVDLDEAVKWFTKASQSKYLPAQKMLNHLYLKSKCISKGSKINNIFYN